MRFLYTLPRPDLYWGTDKAAQLLDTTSRTLLDLNLYKEINNTFNLPGGCNLFCGKFLSTLISFGLYV